MDTRKRHNERKLAILSLVFHKGTITAEKLMRIQGITAENARKRLSRMHGFGYLRKHKLGHYSIAARGKRVRERLLNRREIEKVTGIPVSLNLAKNIPQDVTQKYFQITGKPAPTNI